MDEKAKGPELHCFFAADGSDPLLRNIVLLRDGKPIRNAELSGIQGAKTIRALCIALLWAKYRSMDAELGPFWAQLWRRAPRTSCAATLVENLGEDKDPVWWRRLRRELGTGDTCPFHLVETHAHFNVAYITDSKAGASLWAIAGLHVFVG